MKTSLPRNKNEYIINEIQKEFRLENIHTVRNNPHMLEDGTNMDNYNLDVVLISNSEKPSGRFNVYYSKGYGLKGERPKLLEVVSALVSDYVFFRNCDDFEAFCYELGYDGDSRNVEKWYEGARINALDFGYFLNNAGLTYDVDAIYDALEEEGEI